jgi:hypothetical protein
MKRSPIRQQSARRRAETSARAEVRRIVADRDRTCRGALIVPEVTCGGPMDVDEIAPRGVRPGGHLDPDNCQLLCRAHHDWKHAHPADAHARGLRRWSWE